MCLKDNRDASIESKYMEIFSKYDCFNKVCTAPVTKNKPRVLHYNPRVQRHKPLEKVILSTINVINTDNYDKMLNRFRLLATKDNISTIIREILNKCCMQIFFLNIFVRLISDLKRTSGFKDEITGEIKSFVNKFVDEKEYLYRAKSNIVDSTYDKFCSEQKHKNYTLSKNMLIVELYKAKLATFDIQVYFTIIYQELIRLEKTYNDMFVQMLLDIVRAGILIKKEGYDFDHFDKSNKKLAFMIEELKQRI
jgi:hypothetical protein